MNDPTPPSIASSAPGRSNPSLARLPASPSGTIPALPPTTDLRLRVAYLSDIGRARDHQEDAVGVFVPADAATLAAKGQLLIVADGMGGHQAGEVASRLAVAEIQRAYYAGSNEDLASSLAEAFAAAHTAIHEQAQRMPGERGMGTTAVAAVVRGRAVQIANVGDSRAYLLRAGAITQITEDHSWVARQVQAGILTPEQAVQHPQRNLITRALGKGEAVAPDLFSGELQAGDVLLLCSDGLTRHVHDQELLDIVAADPPDSAVRRLVELTNRRGGGDNITVVVARAEASAPSVEEKRPVPAPAASLWQHYRPLWAAAGLMLIVGLALLAAALLLRSPAGSPRAVTPSAPAAATMPGQEGALQAAPTVMLAATRPPAQPALAPSPAAPRTPTPAIQATAPATPSAAVAQPSPAPPQATATPRIQLPITLQPILPGPPRPGRP